MKIAVWRSGHEISDKVCQAIKDGLANTDLIWSHQVNYMKVRDYDLHIAYGILRGCGDVFKEADKYKLPWIEVDKGYFKPGHYDGYYRISLRGTQQTTGLDKLEPDYARWDALGLDITNRRQCGDWTLVCPPTEHVCKLFGIDNWKVNLPINSVIREKGCERPLQQDLDNSFAVRTFNSSVGLEAIRQGIPVISDPEYSIIGAYQKLLDFPLHNSYEERRKLFAIMASLDLTLEEIRQGKLWEVMNRLLHISGSMQESQLLQTSQPIQSAAEHIIP